MEDVEENLEMGNVGQPLTPEEVARIAHISQRLADDPRAFLGHLDHVTARADSQQSVSACMMTSVAVSRCMTYP